MSVLVSIDELLGNDGLGRIMMPGAHDFNLYDALYFLIGFY